jgi:hypothetical protein
MHATPLTIVCITTVLLSMSIPPRSAADDIDARAGIALYFARHDDAAIAALSRAENDAPLAPMLALADLYFMNGRTPDARRLLLRVIRDHPMDDAAIWLAWMEFAAHHVGDAEGILADVATSGDDSSAARAGLSLAWQRWLRGDDRAAATAFARVTADPAIPLLAEQARLLQGEALLLAHDYAAAEDVLLAVTAPSLTTDAARDLAWIRYRRGDEAGARADLEALAGRDDSGGDGLGVAWPVVLTHGIRPLARRWQHAYRERPRGQDPTVFLLGVADRDASADARDMLHAFFSETSLPTDADNPPRRGARPVERLAASRGAFPAPIAARTPHTTTDDSVGAARLVGLLMLGALAALAARSSRRRRRP